ncbi:hypothetical protein F0U62_12730 [Cystobacter fuscus]|uniref:hypothetical protein n=1 Tax=Cystobacter fuscus TaxID=43 RepID=UPI002B2FD705|nr:hypothetical protein F0U62_12730 [Cystobacter fuscus]
MTLLLVMMMWSSSAEQRAITAMRPQERAEVFTKTTQGFQALCVKEPNPALEPRCRELARFLRYFPECDAVCKRQTMPFLEGMR